MKQQLKTLGIITDTAITRFGIRKLERDPDLVQQVMEHTSFLQYDAPVKVRLQCIIKEIHKQPTCPTCNSPVKMRTNGKYVNTFPTYCGTRCFSSIENVKQKRKSTNINKYGSSNVLQSESIKNKSKHKIKQRYGVDNVLQSPKVREKAKTTLKDRYGVENPSQSKEIRAKAKQTNTEKYGVEYPMQNEIIREQIQQTNFHRYGVENPFYDQANIRKAFFEKHGKEYPLQVSEFKHKMQQTLQTKYGHAHYHTSNIINSIEKLNDYEWLNSQYTEKKRSTAQIARDLEVVESTVLKYLHHHQIQLNKQSQGEEQIALFLNTLPTTFERSNRNILNPKELDFYDPTNKIAIEYNGIFWHSELNGKHRQYHNQKTKQCNDNNIRLLHILDFEWLFLTDIVKSRLCSVYGINQRIYARKCKIEEIDGYQANLFFEQTHIQGRCSSSINYALKYNDDIVAVMSFGKSRYSNKHQYELLRFSNKLYTNVIGGAGKLFAAFLNQYNPTSIVSYSDRRWNTGKLYNSLGFTYSHSSNPNYKYFKPQRSEILYSRISFQKHKLRDKIEHFDPQLTEWQNMVNNGYDRIWDCGNDVYVWNYDD